MKLNDDNSFALTVALHDQQIPSDYELGMLDRALAMTRRVRDRPPRPGPIQNAISAGRLQKHLHDVSFERRRYSLRIPFRLGLMHGRGNCVLRSGGHGSSQSFQAFVAYVCVLVAVSPHVVVLWM